MKFKIGLGDVDDPDDAEWNKTAGCITGPGRLGCGATGRLKYWQIKEIISMFWSAKKSSGHLGYNGNFKILKDV